MEELDARGLFRSTARYYSEFRVPYPDSVIDEIVARVGTDKKRLLDLGCGTGQLGIPLHRFFGEVVAIDISSEMIAEALRVTANLGINNIHYSVWAAEEATVHHFGTFDCIVCGNAFHWMDRQEVLLHCYDMLTENGTMVILAGLGGSIWAGDETWKTTVRNIIRMFLGEERRAGTGTYPRDMKRHEDYIKASRFLLVEQTDTAVSHEWTIHSLIGHLYSTSFCNRELLGERAGEFEEVLTTELLRVDSNGVFDETQELSVFFLRKN